MFPHSIGKEFVYAYIEYTCECAHVRARSHTHTHTVRNVF